VPINYLKDAAKPTPQSEPLDERQVENSAGGFAYQLDDFARLRRFLILGSEGGSYYASQRKLTHENAQCVRRCVRSDGTRAVRDIVEISESGRAPNNDPAIFALAVAASEGDLAVRRAALAALPQVCRIGTHLFHFAEFVESFRGWGRALRRAVADWYTEQEVEKLAYQAVKYRQRDGWSHRDLLRLSHPAPPSGVHDLLFSWIVDQGGEDHDLAPSLEIVEGFQKAQASQSPKETAALVEQYNLPREALKTEHLTAPEVWDAMLPKMPRTAMIRNLANMTRLGVLTPTSEGTRIVLQKLGDANAIRRARVHPIQVLIAQKTYEAGYGMRGRNTWDALAQIVDALDFSFYAAFDNVESTGLRHLLALDVSGSMDSPVMGIPNLSARMLTGAMAMVIARTEPMYECVAFSASGVDAWASPQKGRWGGLYGGRFVDGISSLAISPKQRLSDVMRAVQALEMGGTDCALPMLYASDRNRDVDVFTILTDNETWAGQIHPMEALRKYRRKTGIAAKLAVVGMTATDFSIADPQDSGTLDLVGFDTAVPTLLAGFARGEV
jgi:60 kDa SS-A/Ro ribonucleoprotein